MANSAVPTGGGGGGAPDGAPPTPPVWSVTEVNRAVRERIEGGMYPFWMKGEISNLVLHRSGHVYLSLKDDSSQIRAVFFGGADACRKLRIENGSLIEVFGKLTVYEPRGEYQFAIRELRPAGLGALQLEFERLKQKLAAEGLFDPARKKILPALPRRIGVVTSPSGAAIRDFLQIVRRRFPNLRIQIYPCAVQGASAAAEVARGVQFFNRAAAGAGVEVIVVTRGGGSMEDLWPFNDEALARAIAASRIPVISAVGHEIDFTIADFVADLRCPTPSAAAELVIGPQEELKRTLANLDRALRQTLQIAVGQRRHLLGEWEKKLRFHEPRAVLLRRARALDEADNQLRASAERTRDRLRRALELAAGRLAVFDPMSQVRRGYTILEDAATGEIIRSADQPAGRRLSARMIDGRLPLVTADHS